jgi:hypothetical protein
MSRNNPQIDYWTEYVLEEGWQLSCHFMKEILDELKIGENPEVIMVLLASSNLQKKWAEFATKN